MNYKKDIDKFINKYGDSYSDEVIDYGKKFINRVKSSKLLKEYFTNNNITIYPFLLELIPMSQTKLNIIGKEILDEDEINQVFGTVILNNEILKLLLKNEILINGINKYNEFIYELSDNAIYYFNSKYGIKLNKKFSLRDIIILGVNKDNKF
jgi:hypothetical protein